MQITRIKRHGAPIRKKKRNLIWLGMMSDGQKSKTDLVLIWLEKEDTVDWYGLQWCDTTSHGKHTQCLWCSGCSTCSCVTDRCDGSELSSALCVSIVTIVTVPNTGGSIYDTPGIKQRIPCKVGLESEPTAAALHRWKKCVFTLKSQYFWPMRYFP